MSCNIARFTITKGVENTFVFTIKANGSTLPMVIDPILDSFQATIVSLEDGSVFLDKTLPVTNAPSGQITLSLTDVEANAAISDNGSKADRYYPRPVYKLIIDCDTVNNGKFVAKVNEIYVD